MEPFRSLHVGQSETVAADASSFARFHRVAEADPNQRRGNTSVRTTSISPQVSGPSGEKALSASRLDDDMRRTDGRMPASCLHPDGSFKRIA